jgi:hypothetical protein
MPYGVINVHPTEFLTPPGAHEPVAIDTGLVPLIRLLWSLGFTTLGCCQNFGESILHNQHRSDTTLQDRRRHADFHRNRVWLKMPEEDALRLIGELGDDPIFHQRMRRWTHPEAWQNIVYLFPTSNGRAAPERTAQLTFPRNQLAELDLVLNT